MEIIIDALLDALKDGALSIPILFITYTLMELLERSEKLNEGILNRFSRRTGPAIGGVLGIVPQCGMAGAAATLFSTGAITVGTMLAVFFASSDEMLPIMLSALTDGSGFTIGRLLRIMLSKAALGIALGYIADLVLNKSINEAKNIHSFCEREHCACEEEEGNVFVAALVHTLKIAVMLIAVSFALNLIIMLIGEETISRSLVTKPVVGELMLAVFGLIPNCSISVILTKAYLGGIIGLGGLFAGLLSNAGTGLLVLLRTNKNRRENLIIIGACAGFSFIAGTVITIVENLI